MTKKIFTLVTLMLIAIGGWAQETPTEKVSVFLTAGQSNTAGRCMNENLPDYIKTLGAANDGAYKYCNWSYMQLSTSSAVLYLPIQVNIIKRYMTPSLPSPPRTAISM